MAQSPQLTPPTEFEQAETIEAVDHGGGGLPQLDIDTFPSQIFWLVVALVSLYFLMSRLALPRIASVLEERADAIAGDLDRADELKRRAEQAEQAYKQALADARAEAQTIAARTRAEIQAEVDEATARADAEIAARAAEGEQRIAAIRESAAADVRQVAAETAVAVVERILPGVAGEDDVRQAVDGRLERG